MREIFIDSGILPEALFSFELEDEKEQKIKAIILLQEKNKGIYAKKLLGQSTLNWVKDSVKGLDIEEVTIKNKEDYLDDIIKVVKDEDYVIVLHGDTPLLTSATVNDAIEYTVSKRLDFCKLYRGAIFKVEALKQKDFEYSAEANFLNKEDFFMLFNEETVTTARKILKNRIIDKHLKNKVEIIDRDNVYIEKFVEIDSGVKIYPFNSIKGYTKIKKGSIIREHNIIENSKVNENCSMEFCVLKGQTLEKNTKLQPFTIKVGEKK